MRDRKKRNIIIGSLCCLLVFMGIGYAILSQTLNISGIANMRGNWNVKITNMELLSENKTGRAEEVSHSFTDTTATFTADLYMPGDSIEYRVTVENQGNIDALLKSITPTTTNRSEGIKFSHSEIDNTVLTAGKKITFTMKVEFLEDATSIPKVENVKYNLELVYVQYNGGEYTPAVETTEEDCFMISDDGTLLSYDKSCGTDNVVIPAKVNGIPVKRTMPYFLAQGPIMAIKGDDWNNMGEDSYIYIVKNEKERIKYITKMFTGGCNSFEEYIEYAKNSGDYTEEELAELKTGFESLSNCIEKNICDNVDADTKNRIKMVYVYGSSEYNSLKLISKANFFSANMDTKIYKDTDNTIKVETANSDGNFINVGDPGYNIPVANYCKTEEVCELGKEYLRGEDPAKQAGATSTTYYEYLFPETQYGEEFVSGKWYTIDDVGSGPFFMTMDTGDGTFDTNINYGTIDFSNAVYMEDISVKTIDKLSIKKVVVPPNIEIMSAYSVDGAGEVVFPKNSAIKVIGSAAFWNLKNQQQITIPKSVVSIGAGAFYNSNISTLKFENGSKLVSMYGGCGADCGYGTFYDNNLTSVTIPKSVEYIGEDAFSRNKLASVNFESNSKLKYIGKSGFSGNQLTNVVIPKSIEKIDNYAFGTNKLTAVSFENGTKIKYLSGFNNNQLTDINIPSTVETIGGYAFAGNKLTNIVIPSLVETIGEYAFKSNKLTTVKFAEKSNLKKVINEAFADNQLTNTGLGKFPSSLTYLSSTAFDNNPNLTQITLTSPTDVEWDRSGAWPNGGTVDGKTVTYER